jgi:hypothetical protein
MMEEIKLSRRVTIHTETGESETYEIFFDDAFFAFY